MPKLGYRMNTRSLNFISSLWNFSSNENSVYLTHGLYRWYGKLVPQLVAKVLDLYTQPNDSIIANFSGSGTIALEAMLRNINCIGTDINPLALLLAKVKTTKLRIDSINLLIEQILNEAKKIENTVSVSHLYQPEKWYSGRSAYKLVALKKTIDKIENRDIRDFLYITLAAITRECSNMDSRCVNHIVLDKNSKEKDVYNTFKGAVVNSYEDIKKLNDIQTNSQISFLKHTASDMEYVADSSIDLVFSHPPYLNAVNYYNIYRLSTDLLEMKYDEIRDEDFSAKKIDVFLKFMKMSFAESYRVLKKNKRCVVVIGDTRYKGNLITLQVDFVNLLKECGFAIEDMFIWEMNRKAGMNVARRGNFIDHNFVIVAKKEK